MPTSLYSGREWLEFDAVAPTLVQQAQVLAQTVPPPAKTCPPHTAEAAGYLLKALCQSFAWRHWITTRQATGPLAIGIKSLRQHKNIIENYKRKQYVIDFEEGRPFTTAIAHLKQFRFFLRELHLHQSDDHKPLLDWIQHPTPAPPTLPTTYARQHTAQGMANRNRPTASAAPGCCQRKPRDRPTHPIQPVMAITHRLANVGRHAPQRLPAFAERGAITPPTAPPHCQPRQFPTIPNPIESPNHLGPALRHPTSARAHRPAALSAKPNGSNHPLKTTNRLPNL